MNTCPIQPTTVLVVEDEARYRAFLVDTITAMGCSVFGVASAREAEAHFASSPPTILVLDLNLPVTDGMTLLESFRQRCPDAPVIIITGFGDLAAAQRAIHLDVTEFLSKPCHLGEIECAIDRARRKATEHRRATSPPPHAANHGSDTQPLDVLERGAILKALREENGNRTAAAAKLGISRRSLYNKIATYQRGGFVIP
jgi:DNA-binding NtrC family response regulator